MKKYYLIVIFLFSIFVISSVFIKKNNNILNEKEKIFASNPILASLIKSITKDTISVNIIGYNNDNFHQHKILPSVVSDLKNAKMLFFVSKNDEPSLYQIVNANNINFVEIFQNNELLSKIETEYYKNKKTNNIDPHFWFSPKITNHILYVIKNELIKIIPENKEIFEKNYNLATKKLEKIYNETKKQLNNCNIKSFGIHDAYFYLRQDYNINYQDSISNGHGHELLPKTTSKMLNLSKKQKICLFFNINEEQHLIDKIDTNTDINLVELDSDAVYVDWEKGIDGYIDFIKNNINSIKECIC